MTLPWQNLKFQHVYYVLYIYTFFCKQGGCWKLKLRPSLLWCCLIIQTFSRSSLKLRVSQRKQQHWEKNWCPCVLPRRQTFFPQPHSPLWPAATWTPQIAQWLGRSRSPLAVCTGCSWRKSQRRACALLLKRSLLNNSNEHGNHFTSTIWTQFPRPNIHNIKHELYT